MKPADVPVTHRERMRTSTARTRAAKSAARRAPAVDYPPGHFSQGLSAWWPNPADRPTYQPAKPESPPPAQRLAAANAAREAGKGWAGGTVTGVSRRADERIAHDTTTTRRQRR